MPIPAEHDAERTKRRHRYGFAFRWLRNLRGVPRRMIVPTAYYLVAREGFESDEELARVLGVDSGELARWRRGDGATPENERLLRDLSVVVSELLTVYKPEAVPEWLQGRPPSEPKSPLEWLREGNLAEVLHLINASATGAYA